MVYKTDRPRAAILPPYLCQTCARPYRNSLLETWRPSSSTLVLNHQTHSLFPLLGLYNPRPPPKLEALLNHARSSSLPLIMSADANAHNVVWGSTNVNKRGDTLLNLLLKHNMTIFNDGSKTFHNILRSEALDITFGNLQGQKEIAACAESRFSHYLRQILCIVLCIVC